MNFGERIDASTALLAFSKACKPLELQAGVFVLVQEHGTVGALAGFVGSSTSRAQQGKTRIHYDLVFLASESPLKC